MLRGYVPGDGACGDGVLAHKSTEVRTANGLEIKGFRVLRDKITEPQKPVSPDKCTPYFVL